MAQIYFLGEMNWEISSTQACTLTLTINSGWTVYFLLGSANDAESAFVVLFKNSSFCFVFLLYSLLRWIFVKKFHADERGLPACSASWEIALLLKAEHKKGRSSAPENIRMRKQWNTQQQRCLLLQYLSGSCCLIADHSPLQSVLCYLLITHPFSHLCFLENAFFW